MLLQEYIPLGQRVKQFSIASYTGGQWKTLSQGTTIGYKRILRFPRIKTQALKISIDDARAVPVLAEIQVYNTQDLVLKPKLSRGTDGKVSLKCATENQELYFALDKQVEKTEAMIYSEPFIIKEYGQIEAFCYEPFSQRKSEVLSLDLWLSKDAYTFDEGLQKGFDEQENTYSVLKDNSLSFNLQQPQTVKGFIYLPMQDRYPKGHISAYEFWAGNSENDLKLLKEGEFSNIANNPVEQRVYFREGNYSHFKLVVKSTVDQTPATLAEFGIISLP